MNACYLYRIIVRRISAKGDTRDRELRVLANELSEAVAIVEETINMSSRPDEWVISASEFSHIDDLKADKYEIVSKEPVVGNATS